MRRSCAWCFLLCLWTGCLVARALPISIHSGKITALVRTAEEQKFVNEDEALRRNLTSPGGASVTELLQPRTPDEEQVFVILQLAVFPDRTLSPLDYLLVVDGMDCKCLGMAERNRDFFDFRYLLATGPTEVKLIFACPASARLATLKTALDLPLPAVTGLILQEPEPIPEAVAEPPTETAEEKTEETPATSEQEPTPTPAPAPDSTKEETKEK